MRKKAATMTGAICVVLAIAGVAAGQVSSAEFQRRQRELKAKHQRRAAELKRLHEQRVREMKAAPRKSQQPATAFDPATAPPPVDCLRSYIAAARRATSMEQLLKYLPRAEQRSLKGLQDNYNPRDAAKSRERLKKQNPKLDEAALRHLTNPPYVNELARHKRIAEGMLDVLSVKIDGRKAVIEVSTTSGGKVNGVEYPYGTAKIELLGEEKYWKFRSYNDSSVVYLHPPKPKR